MARTMLVQVDDKLKAEMAKLSKNTNWDVVIKNFLNDYCNSSSTIVVKVDDDLEAKMAHLKNIKNWDVLIQSYLKDYCKDNFSLP